MSQFEERLREHARRVRDTDFGFDPKSEAFKLLPPAVVPLSADEADRIADLVAAAREHRRLWRQSGLDVQPGDIERIRQSGPAIDAALAALDEAEQ